MLHVTTSEKWPATGADADVMVELMETEGEDESQRRDEEVRRGKNPKTQVEERTWGTRREAKSFTTEVTESTEFAEMSDPRAR